MRSLERKREKKNKHPVLSCPYNLIVIFAIWISLGFPGKFTRLTGSSLETLTGYLAFLLELAMMLFSSGKTFLECRLIHMKKKYSIVYMTLVFLSISSMVVTNYRNAELISCIRYSTTAMFGLWLVEHYDTKELLELAYYAQALIILSTIILMLISPSLVFSSLVNENDFVGLFEAKNTCAFQLSFGALLQLILFWIKRKRKEVVSVHFLVVLAIQLVMLVMTRCTGAFMVAILTFALAMAYEKHLIGRIPVGVILPVISVGFLGFASVILPIMSPFFELLGKDATITGRTPLWAQIIKIMSQSHTWFGYGLEMFWRDPDGIARYHAGFADNTWYAQMTTGAHNMILEYWLNLGIIGTAAFLFMIFVCASGYKRVNEERYIFASTFILYLMLRGLTERVAGTYDYYVLFTYIALAMMCNREKKQRRRRRKAASLI